jgi:hypothetical protein
MNNYSQFSYSIQDAIAVTIRTVCLVASVVLVWASFQTATAVTLTENPHALSAATSFSGYITFQEIPLIASTHSPFYLFMIRLCFLSVLFCCSDLVSRFALRGCLKTHNSQSLDGE